MPWKECSVGVSGDFRVRGQMAACAVWPRAPMPTGYFDPFRSDVPVPMFSGNLDPVTPPHLAEEARTSFPNIIHVVLPGAHASQHECIERLGRALFAAGSVKGLDAACASGARNPPFALPDDWK